jgi:hypothetical protein
MSRKSIKINLPAASAGEAADPAPAEPIEAQGDSWIRAEAPAALEPPRVFVYAEPARAGVMLDLSAERTLPEIVTLSLAMPYMLGFWWLMNSLERRRRWLAAFGDLAGFSRPGAEWR